MRWSYSREGSYRECPLKYKLKYIEKLEDPSGKAANRGTEMHETLEKVLDKEPMHHPDWLKPHMPHLQRYVDGQKEAAIYLDDAWVQCKKEDYWLICYIDLLHKDDGTASVIDYKSGRPRDKHFEQVGLYGLSVMCDDPHIDRTINAAYYLDKKPGTWGGPWFLDRNDSMTTLRDHWEERVERMFTDTRFNPRPGSYCNWCNYSKDKGGPCVFGG